jgi:CPA1 family monovalent cation:H+ antiporter
VQAFWEYVAFVANSLVFLLIGMHQKFRCDLASGGVRLRCALGRAVAIIPAASFSRSSLYVPMKHQHVLLWGGLRGAVARPSSGLPPESRSANRSLRSASPSSRFRSSLKA